MKINLLEKAKEVREVNESKTIWVFLSEYSVLECSIRIDPKGYEERAVQKLKALYEVAKDEDENDETLTIYWDEKEDEEVEVPDPKIALYYLEDVLEFLGYLIELFEQ